LQYFCKLQQLQKDKKDDRGRQLYSSGFLLKAKIMSLSMTDLSICQLMRTIQRIFIGYNMTNNKFIVL